MADRADMMTVSVVRDDEIQCDTYINRREPVEQAILGVVCQEQRDGLRWTGHYLTFSSKEWQPAKFSKIAMAAMKKKSMKAMKAMKRGPMKAMTAMKAKRGMKANRGKPGPKAMKAMKANSDSGKPGTKAMKAMKANRGKPGTKAMKAMKAMK